MFVRRLQTRNASAPATSRTTQIRTRAGFVPIALRMDPHAEPGQRDVRSAALTAVSSVETRFWRIEANDSMNELVRPCTLSPSSRAFLPTMESPSRSRCGVTGALSETEPDIVPGPEGSADTPLVGEGDHVGAAVGEGVGAGLGDGVGTGGFLAGPNRSEVRTKASTARSGVDGIDSAKASSGRVPNVRSAAETDTSPSE
ncbi:MAG: hypothetical protein ACRDON_05495 [Gaiellaceae bacterium]